ncbi:MAG: PQ-loop domain-containing transporter [Thaumarchaeota archaeon]|nr:PQ-loop domain-containing transporter [Nitrososphaerota archaeon]
MRAPGFLTYLIYTLALSCSPEIRAQYAARHHGLTPTVQPNDIAFAAHAFLLSGVTLSQYWPELWGFAPNAGTRPSRAILGVLAGCVLGILVTISVVAGAQGTDTGAGGAGAEHGWAWLDVVYAFSYAKLLITVVKYAPQLLANLRNRSTRGWSIWTILLDFVGGVLSIAQQAIDSWLQHDWSGITGNPVKFALGNLSIVYDLLFMTQHYILYRHSNSDDGKPGERAALLENGERHTRLD